MEPLGPIASHIKITFPYTERWIKAHREYEFARFGYWFCAVIVLCHDRLINIRQLQRQHWDLNTWKDEEVQQWKNAHLASCNAIAVAVG